MHLLLNMYERSLSLTGRQASSIGSTIQAIVINDVYFSLKRLGIIKLWKPEYELRKEALEGKDDTDLRGVTIPDALMVIELNGKPRSIALELELTRKNASRYKYSLRNYAHTSHISIIWYVVPSQTTAKVVEAQ